jgi:hypothetical protein
MIPSLDHWAILSKNTLRESLTSKTQQVMMKRQAVKNMDFQAKPEQAGQALVGQKAMSKRPTFGSLLEVSLLEKGIGEDLANKEEPLGMLELVEEQMTWQAEGLGGEESFEEIGEGSVIQDVIPVGAIKDL